LGYPHTRALRRIAAILTGGKFRPSYFVGKKKKRKVLQLRLDQLQLPQEESSLLVFHIIVDMARTEPDLEPVWLEPLLISHVAGQFGSDLRVSPANWAGDNHQAHLYFFEARANRTARDAGEGHGVVTAALVELLLPSLEHEAVREVVPPALWRAGHLQPNQDEQQDFRIRKRGVRVCENLFLHCANHFWVRLSLGETHAAKRLRCHDVSPVPLNIELAFQFLIAPGRFS